MEVTYASRPMGRGLDLHVRCERRGDAAVVTVSGEIDLASSIELRAVLRSEDARAPVVVLDMRGVSFIDSSGLGVIVGQQRRSREDGFRFGIVLGDEQIVQRVFDLSGLRDVLTIVDSPEELLTA